MAKHVGPADGQRKTSRKQWNVYTNFIPYLHKTNSTYHYHLTYLFVCEAVMDRIHKDDSWIFAPPAGLAPASCSTPCCLIKSVEHYRINGLAIKNWPKMAIVNLKLSRV